MEVFDWVDNPSNTPTNCGMSLISSRENQRPLFNDVHAAVFIDFRAWK
jgi:hypothetical protein